MEMTLSGPMAAIPVLGSGLGYRREIAGEIWEQRHAIDFLEIITDQFTGDAPRQQELERLCETFRVIPHGIGLSIGSPAIDPDYLRSVKIVSDITGAPYYSEHLAVTRAPGIDIGHLSPMWFTEEVLQSTARNVSLVQETLGKPIILENVTYLFEIPGAGMSQPEFFHRLVEATGCGVLLDLTNIYVNSVNHHFDPVEFLRMMPLERAVQVHLAGGFWSDDVFVDGHSEAIQEETWHLFEILQSVVKVKGSILEHDANFPDDFSVLLNALARARHIMSA